jgi:hypothetical protein
MPNTSPSTQAVAVSVKDTLEENHETLEGFFESVSGGKQRIAMTAVPEFELNAYSHCYGD